MTEKEIQDILSIVEDVIADRKGDVCHRIAELIRNVKVMYPNEIEMVVERINKILAQHSIDCSNIDQISGKEITDFVEHNVPLAKPLNE